MNLKTLLGMLYVPGVISDLRHVKIVNHEGKRTIIWEGSMTDIQTSDIINENLHFVEILIDHTIPNEDELPDYMRSIIITVV